MAGVNVLRIKAEDIFNKRFKLKSKNERYFLPDISSIFSTTPIIIEPLNSIKEDLNNTKNLLNDKDIVKWRRHTSRTNPCGLVVKYLRDSIKPELCTQAWAKFHEIVSSCNIIPQICLENKKLISLHLCEAPGAFITSLNHYIQSKYPEMCWKWLATTLNPFYEGNNTKQMISGERFIIETLDHWSFGKRQDGDLMELSNLECLIQALSGPGKAHLVTADGSISCADEPDKQEIIIVQLLYCEVVAGLMNLAKGGSFVVKMFTMFEHQTISILFLLSCFFQDIEIIKPGTSKPGNSEVYCVCTLFYGQEFLPCDLMRILQSQYLSTRPEHTLLPYESIPKCFVDKIVECAHMFSNFQKTTINKNLELFDNFTKGKWKFLTKLRNYLAKDYVARFHVVKISQEFFIVSHTYLNGMQLSYWPEGSNDSYSNSVSHHTGSYSERVATSQMKWYQRVTVTSYHSYNVESLVNEIINSVSSVSWLEPSREEIATDDIQNWNVIYGKTIEEVCSSRFCPASLIDEFKEAKCNAKILNTKEGQDFVEKLCIYTEETCQKDQLNNPFNVLHVLHLTGVINDGLFYLLDITGNGRFLSSLLINDHCLLPQLCLALLHENCAVDVRLMLERKRVLTKTCFNHGDEEMKKIKSLVETTRTMETSESYKVLGTSGSKENFSTELIERSGTSSSKYGVIFGSVFNHSSSDHDDELSTKMMLINQCCISLQLLQQHDWFVLEISDTLTQFTVGVIYLLQHLFLHLTLVSPALSIKSKQFLVCRDFIMSPQSAIVLRYFNEISWKLKVKPSGEDIYSVVPIKNLFGEKFFKYFQTHATSSMKKKLEWIIKLEQYFIDLSNE